MIILARRHLPDLMRYQSGSSFQIGAGNTVIDSTSISYESLASSKVCPAKATALIMPVQNVFFGTLKSESFYTSKFKDIDELKIAIEVTPRATIPDSV